MNTDEIFRVIKCFVPDSHHIHVIDDPTFEQMAKDDPLGLSIAKWEVIVHALREGREKTFPLHDGGARTCGLCTVHNMCAICPANCSGRCPFTRYVKASSWEEALGAAEDEVEHLKSLRREE